MAFCFALTRHSAQPVFLDSPSNKLRTQRNERAPELLWETPSLCHAGIATVGVGQKTLNMQTTQMQMTVKQREGFEQRLREVLTEAKRALSDKTDEAHEAALQKIIEKRGATQLVADLQRLTRELEEANDALELLGFEMQRGEVQIAYGASDEFKKSYEEAVNQQIVPETEKVNAIYKALGNLRAVTTVPEAKKTLEAFAS